MPGKQPYFPFYPGDWLKDDALTLCAPATRGVWIDLIARMHERDRSGELRGTAEQLSRAARCSTVEFESAATDLQTTGTAEVEQRNGVYIVRNRRMHAESLQRKAAAERQLRYRGGLNGAASNAEKTKSSEYENESLFEEFWKAYPQGRKKSKAKAREAFQKALAEVPAATMIEAARQYAASDEGRGKYVKMPATWINGECWHDDKEAWRDKDTPANEKQFQEVDAATFAEWYRLGKFKQRPTRHTTHSTWVFGELRDGRKVECRDYPLPEKTSAPLETTSRTE